MRDYNFEKALLLGDYKIAYDPLTKHYVSISGVEIDTSGTVVIRGQRFSDYQLDRYKPYELTQYS